MIVKLRKSNFELLRIVAMLMIVFYHCTMEIMLDENGTLIMTAPFSLNQVFCFILGAWGIAGVGAFFLISSHFMIEHNNFSSKKLSKIVLETSFWSVIIWVICSILHIKAGSGIKALVEAVVSPFIGKYWFVTAYIFLYILSPFLNHLIEGLDIKVYRKFMIVITIIMPLYSTIYTSLTLCDVGLAVYYYFLWGYLKRCPNNRWERNAKKVFVISVLAILLIGCLASGCCTLLNVRTVGMGRMSGRYSVFQIVPAVSLFYIFKNMKIKSSRIINTIASAVFGVYLIHEGTYNSYLWNNLFHLNELYTESRFVLFYVGAVLLVFVASIVLELIYKNTIEKSVYKNIHVLDRFFTRVDCFIK